MSQNKLQEFIEAQCQQVVNTFGVGVEIDYREFCTIELIDVVDGRYKAEVMYDPRMPERRRVGVTSCVGINLIDMHDTAKVETYCNVIRAAAYLFALLRVNQPL